MQITFVAPPGIGLKDIDVSIRGNSITLPTGTTRPRLLYAPPIVTGAQASLMNTSGGSSTPIVLEGFGFGPDPADPFQVPGNPFAYNNVPLNMAPGLPTAYVRVDFSANSVLGPQCVQLDFSVTGGTPMQTNPNCMPPGAGGLMLGGYSPTLTTSLTFNPPPGVGTGYAATVAIVDAATNAVLTRSNTFVMGYYPPQIVLASE